MNTFLRQLAPNRLASKGVLRCFSTIEQKFLVINAVGLDRPGIVSDITKLVVDQGGNVGESQASRLGSHFGLMMLVEIPTEKSEALQNAVKEMKEMNTTCYDTGDPNTVQVTPENGYTGEFILRGADNPGIVHKVTQILAKHRLNIDSLKTSEDKSVPYGGVSLFTMSGTATTPLPLSKSFDPDIVRTELEELGDQMNCDITLEDVLDASSSASFYVA